jgi:hypothetical protein
MPTLAKTRVWWLGRIGARLDGLRAQKQVIGGFPVGTAFRNGPVLAAEAGLLSTLDELVPEARLAIPELDRQLAASERGLPATRTDSGLERSVGARVARWLGRWFSRGDVLAGLTAGM